MTKKCLISLCLSCFASQVLAADSPWELCVVEGYFMSTNSLFLAGLANRQAERAGIVCLDSQRSAYFEGQALARRIFNDQTQFDGRMSATESKVSELVDEFQNRVNDFVLDGMAQKKK